MGPRELSRGWVGGAENAVINAVALQWGRGSCPADGRGPEHRSKGRRDHFNGAAGVVPRMEDVGVGTVVVVYQTSMGPRELSRGWRAAKTSIVIVLPTSMGPRELSRGWR